MDRSHLPQIFPCTLHSLEVTFAIIQDGWSDPLGPDALLHSIAPLAFLKELILDLVAAPYIQLTSRTSLPALSVSLRLAVKHDTVMDLSWLHQQPCSALSVEIYMQTGMPSQHQLAVSQLLLLPLHSLSVYPRCGFPLNLQSMWQRISPSNSFTLDVSGSGPASGVLQALPHCRRIILSTWGSELVLEWAAVSSRAARYSLHSYQGRPRILGAPQSGLGVPAHLEGAWQLTVRSSTSVPGLQGACAHGHFLQNSAAILAGWTADFVP